MENLNLQVYQFFGQNLVSQYPFTSNLYGKIYEQNQFLDSSMLYFGCNQYPPFAVNWKRGKLVYYYCYHTPDGDLWDKLHHFDDFDIFQFAWGADFYLRSDRIDCYLRDPTHWAMVELYLMGPIIAFWLEREGFPALHASSVSINRQSVVFPSHSGNGKSTLAAAFLQLGKALLTDDILPVQKHGEQFWGLPGLPQINLWPNQISHFVESKTSLKDKFSNSIKKRVPVEAIRNGTFCHEKRPLACLYVPSKSDPSPDNTKIVIAPLPHAEAMIELIRYSFVFSRVFENLGWQARRMVFFAHLVEQIPVRRLIYPAGFEHLPRVTEAVLEDLERLPSQ